MTIFHAAHPTDAEIDAHLARCHQRAARAWDTAATPGPWERPTPEVDAAAESRREQDNYEYAQLMLREESF